MRFQWHRSFTFWLGVPGLLFLAWIWLLSVNHRTDLSICGPNTVFVANEAGFLRITCWKDPALTAWSDFKIGNIELLHSTRFFPGFAWRLQTHSGVFDLWLAHWLLVFLYQLLWGIILAWRCWKFRPSPALRSPRAA